MLHAKFLGNRTIGSGDEDFLMGFYHMWAWRTSWSCDPDAVNKSGFDWQSGFREEDLQKWLTDGHRYTISSPCEPNGSCKLNS